ncbi:diaminopimelate epimerase [Neobacillus piezotolerans]|uniref:Diaminopimelate epimerase n=1 Tax=Neobacillus piezotolerans TaxID=2259171 RepID=A0A3D8GQA1_9BACI|nr:diaminopimelate epimerase [Neobacillus piezotolerans]RDU36462.1 diaminopimelate epimerase [Neobacillus piezotolerans]
MEFQFIKVHGSGNDFILIDELSGKELFTEEERAEAARLLCDRENGPGADGILFIQKSDHADAVMRVFNADGSEASMCGNGLRCAARYVCEELGKDSAVIETMKADLPVKKYEEISEGITTYNVEISPVLFRLKDLPLNLPQETLQNGKIAELSDELLFTAVAVPNPHLIAIVSEKELRGTLQKELSEKVNRPNSLFPDGVNVSFVKPLEAGHIYVRTFERGVGFTNACGTAMSASSLVTCLNGMNELDLPITVYNDGGMVQCIARKFGENYKIELIGNATFMYSATGEVDFLLGRCVFSNVRDFGEQELYNSLQEKALEFIAAHK